MESNCFCRVVHCKKEPYDVYIGRPSKWGNPFTHLRSGKTRAEFVVGSRDEAIEAYREWITNGDGIHLMNDLHELKGKVLGCWCHPKPCHGDVLSELVAKQQNNIEDNKGLLMSDVRSSKNPLTDRNDPLILKLQELALRFRDEHEDQEGFQKLDDVIYKLLALTNED